MLTGKSNAALGAGLVFAIALWGGNNAGTRWLVQSWPPVFTGGTRFLCAGLLLLATIRWTSWLGTFHPITPDARRRLWWRGGLSLAAYIVTFNGALVFTSASHVALYLGASPVWALLWEGANGRVERVRQRLLAALLALGGVFVLLWPALHNSHTSLPGELLGLGASVLWTNYGRQCRALSSGLGAIEITAHTMWRAGTILLPVGAVELATKGISATPLQLGVQAYCVVAGGVIAFALWTHALRHWQTSQVLMFNNLIPLSTMTWAHFCLDEPVTQTFWIAMVLIATGVVLGQTAVRADNPKAH
ncbi:MAG: DMT family transporter [Verrucomicrobia bacterium]|nr:DMT family transporter [Verrucomicrobiota bacterium]